MTESSLRASLDRWRLLQDALMPVLGIYLCVVDRAGNPLTRPLHPLSPPWNVLMSSAKGLSRYQGCVQSLLKEAHEHPRPLIRSQMGGLHLCVIPIGETDSPSAHLLIGPCLVGGRGEPDDHLAFAREFEIPINR